MSSASVGSDPSKINEIFRKIGKIIIKLIYTYRILKYNRNRGKKYKKFASKVNPQTY